jgi:hypothetical protein
MMAFTAPVRLRAVASGLMIEKVRSIAMILSLELQFYEGGALITAAFTNSKLLPPCSTWQIELNCYKA